jgi:5-methylcytosine-specific restriction endonuclease McrA
MTRLVKTCQLCGNAFDKTPNYSMRAWAQARYCSKSCSDKSKVGRKQSMETIRKRVAQFTGELSPCWKGGFDKRAWRHANPDKERQYHQTYRMRHLADQRLRDRTRKQRLREYYAQVQMRRHARQMGARGSHSLRDWLNLKLQHGNRCLACGQQEPAVKLTRDHIVPLIAGGTNFIDNIQPLCGPCNSSKSVKVIDYRKRGELAL